MLILSDRRRTGGRSLPDALRGAPAVVLREKDLPRAQRVALAAELRGWVDVLLVASDVFAGADGTHLAAADPFPARRPPIVGRSCHDHADLRRAAAEGCDYATLSPIFPTSSKPGYGPALGVRSLAGSPLSVYALGGVTPLNAAACRHAGAAGVAVMGTAMSTPDLAVLVEALRR